MKTIFGWIGSLVALAIGFGLLNGALWVIQEVYHYRDTKRCEGIKLVMQDIKRDIDRYESNSYIRSLSDQYTRQQEYNRYSRLIDEYNELVEEYNELASSVYRRWWLLPFPAPSRH